MRERRRAYSRAADSSQFAAPCLFAGDLRGALTGHKLGAVEHFDIAATNPVINAFTIYSELEVIIGEKARKAAAVALDQQSESISAPRDRSRLNFTASVDSEAAATRRYDYPVSDLDVLGGPRVSTPLPREMGKTTG